MSQRTARDVLHDSQTIVVRPRRPGGSGAFATIRPASIGTNVSDSDLVRRMLEGEAWAKEAFYRKHVARAYRVARRLVRQCSDAEDVVQEAFAQAFVDLPQLRESEMLGSWFLRIVVNRAHRRFRRRRLLSFFGWGAGDEGDGFEASSECPADVATELSLVAAALRKAPATARTAWILRRVEGCSLNEVAEACACSLATTKRKISQVDDIVALHVEIERGGAPCSR